MSKVSTVDEEDTEPTEVELTERQFDFLTACQESNENQVVYLLKTWDIDVELCVSPGSLMSCLHISAKDYDLTKRLLENSKVDVNALDVMDCTPLHFAVWEGKYDVVKLLIDNGADVNWTDVMGEHPLFFAIRKKYMKVVRLLVRRGSLMTIRNSEYKLPFDYFDEELKANSEKYLLKKCERWDEMKRIMSFQLSKKFEMDEYSKSVRELVLLNEAQKAILEQNRAQIKAIFELKENHQSNIKVLEEENVSIREDLETVRSELLNVKSNHSPQKKFCQSHHYLLQRKKNKALQNKVDSLYKKFMELKDVRKKSSARYQEVISGLQTTIKRYSGELALLTQSLKRVQGIYADQRIQTIQRVQKKDRRNSISPKRGPKTAAKALITRSLKLNRNSRSSSNLIMKYGVNNRSKTTLRRGVRGTKRNSFAVMSNTPRSPSAKILKRKKFKFLKKGKKGKKGRKSSGVATKTNRKKQ